MFETINYRIDSFLFIVALVLEFWGLINLMNVMNLSPFSKLALVGGGILVDLLFAIGAHWNQRKICRAENEILLVKYAEIAPPNQQAIEGRIEDLKGYILKLKITPWICKIILIGLALIKISFFKANAPIGNSLVFPIIVTYVIVAVIHIYATGYFGAEFVLRAFYLRPEWNKYRRNQRANVASINDLKGKGTPVSFPENAAITQYALQAKTLRQPNPDYVPHQINVNQNDKTYEFVTFGVLTDAQLKNFVNQQGSKEAEKAIAKEGLHRQWQQQL